MLKRIFHRARVKAILYANCSPSEVANLQRLEDDRRRKKQRLKAYNKAIQAK